MSSFAFGNTSSTRTPIDIQREGERERERERESKEIVSKIVIFPFAGAQRESEKRSFVDSAAMRRGRGREL